MSSINFDQLSIPSAKLAWNIARRQMSNDFFSSKMACVCNLDEANYFKPMVCFSKPNPGGPGKIFTLTGDYFCLHGHVTELIKKNGFIKTDMEKLEFASRQTIKAEMEEKSKFGHWEHGNKFIKVRLSGLTKEVINWSNLREGDLVFDSQKMDLEERRSLYVITQVIYAKRILVEANNGKAIDMHQINVKTPVAFAYAKFPIFKDGILQPANNFGVHTRAVFAPMMSPDPTPSPAQLKSVLRPFVVEHKEGNSSMQGGSPRKSSRVAGVKYEQMKEEQK